MRASRVRVAGAFFFVFPDQLLSCGDISRAGPVGQVLDPGGGYSGKATPSCCACAGRLR